MTNPRFRPDPQREFATRTKLLADHGVEMPPELEALRRRQTDFDNLGHPCLDRLVDQVTSGGPTKNAGTAEMFALAVAESLNASHSGVIRKAVHDACHQQAVQIYRQVAADNYRAVAAEWNTLGAQFSGQAKLIDPEMPAIDAHRLPEPERQAWIAVEQTAHQLDLLQETLIAAAALAGVKDTDLDTVVLPLCVDVDGHHRRRLWASFDTKGTRCSRWSALHALGATIRAHPAEQLDNLEPYAEPAPVQHVQRPDPDKPGRVTNVVIDPEDGSSATLVAPFEVRRPSGLTVA